jgi:hypothetical protein
MRARPLLTLLIATAACGQAPSAETTVTIPARGEFAKVDVERTMHALQVLGGDDKAEREKVMDDIQENSASYAPPAFFALAAAFWEQGNTWNAVFWFNAGRLRGRYDGARCADLTAAQGVDVMVMQMPDELRRAQFQDLDRFEATIRKVVRWDEETLHKYDHRWINLHGIDAYLSSFGSANQGQQPQISLPESEWPALAQQAREGLLIGLEAALELLRQDKAGTSHERRYDRRNHGKRSGGPCALRDSARADRRPLLGLGRAPHRRLHRRP